jgi:hypothetical protein
MDNIGKSCPGGLQASRDAVRPGDVKKSGSKAGPPEETSGEVRDRVEIKTGRRKGNKPAVSMAATPAPSKSSTPSTPREKEVTVLFYMNGQYPDLEPGLADSFLNLESLGSNSSMNLVAQIGRASQDAVHPMGGRDRVDNDWEGVRRYYVVKGNEPEPEEPLSSLDDWRKIADKLPGNPLVHFQLFEELKKAGRTEEADREYKEAERLGYRTIFDNSMDPRVGKWSLELEVATQGLRDKAAPYMNFSSPVAGELKKTTNMGNPYNLQDFVSWGMRNYPARHYVVVLMGHGGAWTGALEMGPADLAQAVQAGVQNANQETGRRDQVDSLVFNSCYMGNLETAEQMKDASRTVIASEMSALSSVFQHWPEILGRSRERLEKGQPFDAVEFARDYVEYYRQRGESVKNEPDLVRLSSESYLTLAALDNRKVEGVSRAWQDFINVWKESGVQDSAVFKDISKAKNYPSFAYSPEMLFDYGTLRDLGSIASRVISDPSMPESMKDAAAGIIEALKAAVINEQHTGNRMEGSTGLSVWAPTNAADIALMADAYNEKVPAFTQATDWSEKMIQSLKNVNREKLVKYMAVIEAIGQLMQMQNTPGLPPGENDKIELKLQALKMEARRVRNDLELSREHSSEVPRYKLYQSPDPGKEDELEAVFQRMQKSSSVSMKKGAGIPLLDEDLHGSGIISKSPRETVVSKVISEIQLKDGMSRPHRPMELDR